MDLKEIRDLLELIDDTKGIEEFEMEQGDLRIRIRKANIRSNDSLAPVQQTGMSGAVTTAAAPAEKAAPAEATHLFKAPIVGTFYLTVGTAIFSVPLGIAAAIYLAEYASDNWLTRIIRIAIINLSGIPSVVYGLFGLGLFVLFLKFGTSILSASLTLSIMTLPVIISTSEEALRAVPQPFRTVSISLGATRWQTIRRIVLPEALPGIITGVILGLERAAGETAPILFTGAAFFLPRLPNSVFDATMALPYHLFVISTQVPEMPFQIQYGTALVLIAFVLGMNLVAAVIRSRARARRQW